MDTHLDAARGDTLAEEVRAKGIASACGERASRCGGAGRSRAKRRFHVGQCQANADVGARHWPARPNSAELAVRRKASPTFVAFLRPRKRRWKSHDALDARHAVRASGRDANGLASNAPRGAREVLQRALAGDMRAMTASAMAARPVATPSARASDSSDVNTKRHRGRGAVRPVRGERSGLAFASSARRRVAEAPRALSDPVETESKAERFLREQLEREGVDVDAAVAPESPEQIVAALEEEVARLAEREASLTRDLDAAYRATFADLVVQVPSSTGARGETPGGEGDEPRTEFFACPKDVDEASFRASRSTAANAPAASALLDAAQRGDQAKWLAFQRGTRTWRSCGATAWSRRRLPCRRRRRWRKGRRRGGRRGSRRQGGARRRRQGGVARAPPTAWSRRRATRARSVRRGASCSSPGSSPST